MEDSKIRQMFLFQLERHFTNLFISFLETLEDQKSKHEIMVDKLKQTIPKEYHNLIDNANYFDEKTFMQLRKRVLDVGNRSLKSAISYAEDFEITVNFNR